MRHLVILVMILMTTPLFAQVKWVEVTNANIVGNGLQKTSPSGQRAGAITHEVIPAGSNGYFEFTVAGNFIHGRFGVSHQNNNAEEDDIDYSIDVWWALTTITVHKADDQLFLSTGHALPTAGNPITYRVERLDDDIIFTHINGSTETVIGTINAPETGDLVGDLTLAGSYGEITGCSVNITGLRGGGGADGDWLVAPSGQQPVNVGEEIFTDGRVGINTSQMEAILHTRFPFACGSFHQGNYNALFDARDGAFDNVVSLNGFFPAGTGNEGTGCSEGGWNGAYIVQVNDLGTGGGITETARIHANGNAIFNGVWVGSDSRYKSNIKPIKNALDIVTQLNGKSYDFKFAEYASAIPSTGFIAQEIQGIVPELTRLGENDRLAVNYDGFIPILTEAIKEQQEMLDEKNMEIEELRMEIQEIREIAMAICTDGCDGVQSKMGTTNNGPSETNGANLEGATVFQNVPNPFNSTTEISYFLPATVQSATMYVYNLQGRQEAKYPLAQQGNGTLTIKAQSLPAGIYFYTLIADGEEVATKRMILTD